MTNAQKISKLLEQCGESVQILERKRLLGFIPITISRGWLWIIDADDHWNVILANGERYHQPLSGPALGADFLKENGERKIGPAYLRGAWKSALSMWPIGEEDEAIKVFGQISNQVDLAFRFHCQTSAERAK